MAPASGPITSVTGTGTIPGAKGGSATVVVSIRRYSFGSTFIYVGAIAITDTGSHLKTTALVLTTSLTRVGTGEVSGTAIGLLYLLNWTL